jgi:Uma2 family endonuclease
MSAASTLVPVEEYVRKTYKPDCDYVEGELRERHVGQYDHSRLQALILVELYRHETDWNIHVLPEQRLKISATRYRIPDVMVLAADAPRTRIIETAPLVTIEILSPDDTLADLAERAEDYSRIGVQGIWILDPWQHKVYMYTSVNGLRQAPASEPLVCGSIRLDPAALFQRVGPAE